jgi:hypothetical protein
VKKKKMKNGLNRLSEFFNEEEKKHWERILKRLSENPAFNRLADYVAGRTTKLDERDFEVLADELEPLLDKFVPIPFGSRVLNPHIVSDLLGKYVIDITEISLDEFYRVGAKVQEIIKTGRTWLALPQEIFGETDFENIIKLLGATVLHLPKLVSRTLGLLGQHMSSILRGASENEKFAKILFRHGVLDINEDGSFTVHFDRFIIALGEPAFIEEASEFLLSYLPMEVFYGPQSVTSIALSRSIANGLFAAAVAAKQSNQQERFVNFVAKCRGSLEKIHEQITSLQPDWETIISNLNQIFDGIEKFTESAEKEFAPLYRITHQAGEVGLYPDIGIEAAGLATRSFTASDWEWLEKTQEIAIKVAAQTKPLYRQPIYWLALTCLRIFTAPDKMPEKIESIISQFSAGKILPGGAS